MKGLETLQGAKGTKQERGAPASRPLPRPPSTADAARFPALPDPRPPPRRPAGALPRLPSAPPRPARPPPPPLPPGAHGRRLCWLFLGPSPSAHRASWRWPGRPPVPAPPLQPTLAARYKELLKLNTQETNKSKNWAEDMNRHFSNDDIQRANRHVKKYSKSLAIREIQIETTLRYHLTPVRMAKIDKTRNNNCWSGCEPRGSLLHCWWECKLVQPLWKTVWRSLKKLKIELPFDSANCTTGYLPQRHRRSEEKGHMHPNVHSSIVHNC